jgi:hypothetical protein
MNKLSPENLFVPSQKNVRGILARYNVPLTRFEHATSGIENLTLIVWSQRKKYVLRVYPQKKKSDAAILLELDFMSHLRNNGLPLPAIISSSDNQPFVVYEFGNKKWQRQRFSIIWLPCKRKCILWVNSMHKHITSRVGAAHYEKPL